MDKNKTTSSSLMHTFTEGKVAKFPKKLLLLIIAACLFGIGTGYVLARMSSSSSGNLLTNTLPLPAGKTFGDGDPKIFKDTAEGVLKEGGIEGEGQYHLERPGGISQNVYMTSSTVDLSQFINKKIKVWGQTQKAQKAGWLMDVGKVQGL